jgi:hypothetical protein
MAADEASDHHLVWGGYSIWPVAPEPVSISLKALGVKGLMAIQIAILRVIIPHFNLRLIGG